MSIQLGFEPSPALGGSLEGAAGVLLWGLVQKSPKGALEESTWTRTFPGTCKGQANNRITLPGLSCLPLH